ncbi:hypothetical protein F4604DRAFT_1937096 [Suillus subluteus]|nr:hypothetical protein F4604DRAFT_1937096 [Suillus subluteus]
MLRQVSHADRQRDEAEARRRVVEELDKYLVAIESRTTADARALRHDHSPHLANPSITAATVEPLPRSSYSQSHHRYTSSSLSSATFPPGSLLPPGPLPPPPSTRGFRPHSGSFDDPSYNPSLLPNNHPEVPSRLPPCHADTSLTSIPTPNSFSRFNTSATILPFSLLIDLTPAPIATLVSMLLRPSDQPGELRTYQTYIFAPPVTGNPQKKGKLASSANITHNGSPLRPSDVIDTPIILYHVIDHVLLGGDIIGSDT